MKGVFAFNLNPMKWRFGFEHTVKDKRVWKWLLLGPIAINTGEV